MRGDFFFEGEEKIERKGQMIETVRSGERIKGDACVSDEMR